MHLLPSRHPSVAFRSLTDSHNVHAVLLKQVTSGLRHLLVASFSLGSPGPVGYAKN